MQERLHAIVSGRVQFVMYRDFVTRNARRLHIVGTVQNLPDGTVRVHAEGSREALERLVRKLHAGPILAHVTNVHTTWTEPSGEFHSFSIAYD